MSNKDEVNTYNAFLSYLESYDNRTEIQSNLAVFYEKISSALDGLSNADDIDMIKILLKCLNQLVIVGEAEFKPFSNVTLYKALEFLTESDEDDELKIIPLMIIYSLTRYCDEQMVSLKSNIIDYMLLLKNGKNETVDDLCGRILAHFEIEGGEGIMEMKMNDEKIMGDDDNDMNMNNKHEDEEEEYVNDDFNWGKKMTFKKEENEEDEVVINNNNGNNNVNNSNDKNVIMNNNNNNNNNDLPMQVTNETVKTNQNTNANPNTNDFNINILINKIKELSEHQLILLDTIDKYKEYSTKIINDKKNEIAQLEQKIQYLSTEISNETQKHKQNIHIPSSQHPIPNQHYHPQQTQIETKLLQLIHSQNDTYLIKQISSLQLTDIKQISPPIVEKIFSFLLTKTPIKKQFAKTLIKFTKIILLGLKMKLSSTTMNIINQYLINIEQTKEYDKYLTENEYIDINLLLSLY